VFLDRERRALCANGTSPHAFLNLRYFMRTVAGARGPVNRNLGRIAPLQPLQPLHPGDAQSLLAIRFSGLSR